MVASIGKLYAKVNDYAQDNYYTKDVGLENSQWYGRGASILGLQGRVLTEDYNRAYGGIDPQGLPLRQRQSGKKANPGRDITLSAPKSVSLLSLVKEDKKVVEAHQQAVRHTLNYVEKNCVFTRTGQGGANRQQTDNALIAIFQHDDNRNLDPQLHSHCVIFNQTRGEDGKWRSMDNRELYQQKMTIGMVYHHELARELKQLGYELSWNRDGTFEVYGYTPEQLKVFSSRRQEIENAVGKDASAAKKARACTRTRRGKVHQATEERAVIKQQWLQKAELALISHPQPEYQNRQQLTESLNRNKLIAEAIAVTSEQQVTFPKHILFKELLRQSQGNHRLEDLQQELDNHRSLIKTNDGRLITTAAITKEQIIKLDENIGQQDINLKQVVDLLAAGEIEKGYRLLQDNNSIKQIPVDSLRRDAVVTDYLQRDDKTRVQTIVLTDTNVEREAITNQIRQGLIEREKLGKDSRQIQSLKPKVLDKFSLNQASSYQIGDVIKFGRNSALFDAKLYYQVDEVDSKNSIIKLRDRYSSIQSIELNRYKDREVFQPQTLELRSGEVMKFTRNQYRDKLKPINGQQFTILGFEDDGRVVIKTKGKTQTVTPDSLLYSDYRYVDTVHSSRGKTTNYCIYAAGSGNSLTVSKESFSVAASRARKEFTVYTASSQALGVSVTKSRGQENALPPINNQKPARSSEFKLLVAAKYLVEQQGKLNSSKPLEKIYQSIDGTSIRRTKNSLTITQGNRELQFGSNNATVKNTFSALEIESQIKARTNEMQQHLQLNQTQTQEWSISISR
jgi:conjugative relaxase-like TrwC/TraI family protein